MAEGKKAPERKTDLLLAFLLPAAVFFLILFRYRILPFGETTLLFSDLDSQYIEFMAEYRRILLGKGSFFYSWNAGLGMNFPALIAYYLASPFNLLLPLFPEDQLPLAVSLITALKLSCAGTAFACYLKKKYPEKTVTVPALSACYALSAFAVGYAFNIMWLDALIWLPLLCAAIDALPERKQGAIPLLVLFLALSFISQFYMAWMTGAFCALYFLTRLLIRKDPPREWLRQTLCFAAAAGIAAGLSAFLLVPTWFVLKNNMGLMGQAFPPASGAFSFTDLLPRLFIGSFDGIKDVLPHIYCGLPALIGLTLFFTSNSIPLREKIVSGLTGAFLLFSFWFRPFDFIWHALDHPSWFPYRYAFLFPFWALSCASAGFAGSGRDRSLLRICLLWLIPPAAVFFFGKGMHLSLFLINAGALAVYAVIALLPRGKTRTVLFTAVCAAELLLNSGMIIGTFADRYTKLADYQDFRRHYRTLTEPLLPEAEDFYRMEKTEIRNYNDPLGIGFPGVSHFSSTASTRQAEFLKRLGFNCYATWCTYQGSTAAADALLRIRYEFAENGKAGSLPAGTETWEHPAQFPLFFFASEDFTRYDFFSDEKTAIPRQNDLLRLLDEGDEDFFEPLPVRIRETVNLEKGSDIFRQTDPEKPAYISLEIGTQAGRSSYLFISEASLNYNVFINDSQVINAARDYAPFPICLDKYAPDGGTVQARVETVTGSVEGEFLAWSLDTEKLLKLSERVTESAPETKRISRTVFRLKTDPADRDRPVISSIPFDAGWRVKANGKRLDLKMIHGSMLGFILPAGCTEIEVSYRPYGWEPGLALTLTAAVIFVLLPGFNGKGLCGKKRDRAKIN